MIVIRLEGTQFPFQIPGIPEEGVIQEFSPCCSNQAFYEGM